MRRSHFQDGIRAACLCGVAIAGALLVAGITVAQQKPELTLAATGIEAGNESIDRPERTHLWVVQQMASNAYRVLHRTSEDPPNAIYFAVEEGRGRIEAVAANGDTFYTLFSSRSVQAVRYQPRPPPEPAQFVSTQWPILPEGVRPVGMAASAAGPIILGAAKPVESDASIADGPVAYLYRSDGKQWTAQSLPTLNHEAFIAMGAYDDGATQKTVIAHAAADRALVLTRVSGDETTQQRFNISVGKQARMVQLRRGGSIIDTIVHPGEADTNGRMRFHILRTDATEIDKRGVAVPSGRWWALADLNAILIVREQDDGSLSAARVPFPDGEASGFEQIEVTTRPIEINTFQVVLVTAVVIALLFMLLSGRRDTRLMVPNLPEGVRPAGFNRIVAAMVDFAPAISVSMVLYDLGDPSAMVERVMRQTPRPEDALPGLTAFGVHVVHTTLTELFFGRTLGKVICGCRVVSMDGSRPHAPQILARNVFKLLEMLMPFLLIWPLFFSHYQRLGDLIARTVVVTTLDRRRPPGDGTKTEESDVKKDD